jgi:hypothetical protein
VRALARVAVESVAGVAAVLAALDRRGLNALADLRQLQVLGRSRACVLGFGGEVEAWGVAGADGDVELHRFSPVLRVERL